MKTRNVIFRLISLVLALVTAFCATFVGFAEPTEEPELDADMAINEKVVEIVTKEVLELLADKSYSAEFGARNIRRVVQKDIEDKVVEEMCNTDIIPQKITIGTSDGEIVVDVK